MVVEQVTYANISPQIRKMIMVGLTFAMLIACLDGTIIGTTGTIIAKDLEGLGLYSWMATAYLLTETVMIPISGKLSDLYGRKPLFLIGLSVFVIGSFCAGLSQDMTMFIVCRAVQGVGGGILIPVAMAAVADLYSPVERPKMQGMLGAIFGIGSGIGPLIGGYITEYISWHWCFYINIPLAVVAFFLTIKKFPTPDQSDVRVDYKGITSLSVFLLAIILFFEFGGDKFEWASLESAALIAIAAVTIVLFVLIERRVPEPIIAPHLIHNRTVIVACTIMFLFGLTMMGAMMYSNMFFIFIFGGTTIEAGEYSLALVIGMMITSLSSGALVNRTGYRLWIIPGAITVGISFLMFSTLNVDSSRGFYALCLFVLGIGLGCLMSVVMAGVQNSAEESEMGMTTSSVNLLRSIGTTVGTAIFAMIINGRIDGELLNILPKAADFIIGNLKMTGTDMMTILDSNQLLSIISAATGVDPESISSGILKAFANSVDFTFLVAVGLAAVIAVVGVFFKAPLPEMPPKGGETREGASDEPSPDAPGNDTPAAYPVEDRNRETRPEDVRADQRTGGPARI